MNTEKKSTRTIQNTNVQPSHFLQTQKETSKEGHRNK